MRGSYLCYVLNLLCAVVDQLHNEIMVWPCLGFYIEIIIC